jgi:hypothetical protein
MRRADCVNTHPPKGASNLTIAELEENVCESTGVGVDCAKNNLRAVQGGLGGKHKYLAVGCRSDFRLEAHQVLRLVYILTFNAL